MQLRRQASVTIGLAVFPWIQPQKPKPAPTKQPAAQQQKQSRLDCILSAIGKYLTNESVTRLDNAIRDGGNAVGHPKIGDFVAGLTVVGSLAALGNTALNLTSLGRYPRGGLGGASPAGSPTTWQHTAGGAAGRALEEPIIGRVGRLAGRASEAVSLSLLVFEATYTANCRSLMCCRLHI